MHILIGDPDPDTWDAVEVVFRLLDPSTSLVCACNGDQVLGALEPEPDLVVLSAALPDGSGLRTLRQLRRTSSVPVLIVGPDDGAELEVEYLETGADRYLTKPLRPLLFLAHARAVLRRQELTRPEQSLPDLTAGDLVFHQREHSVQHRGRPVRLTPVEFKLLYLLARQAGRLVRQEQLLHQVWGSDRDTSPDHLKVYVSRLREKLKRGLGYRLVATPGRYQPLRARPNLAGSEP
jgi:DNA-binding response OmpR family regulator